jgi:hypothetical protein
MNKSADARQSSRSTRQKEVTKRKLSYKRIRRRLNSQNHRQKKEKTLLIIEVILDDRSLRMDYTMRKYLDLRKNKRFT